LGSRQLTALLMAIGASCGHAGAAPELTLKESSASPYYLPRDAEGVGFSAGVVNHTDRSLQITGVHVDADPELTVTYVGWATCLNGCFGTSSWTDIRKEMAEGHMVPDGTLPVPVPPKESKESQGFAPVSLEFRVVLDSKLLGDPKPCHLVRRITVDLKSGEKNVPIEYPDGSYPFAIQATNQSADPACLKR
jgi:hypothetical protein